jgi:hypothetical protein
MHLAMPSARRSLQRRVATGDWRLARGVLGEGKWAVPFSRTSLACSWCLCVESLPCGDGSTCQGLNCRGPQNHREQGRGKNDILLNVRWQLANRRNVQHE